jgi:ketosteroid isomerase-like protein
MAASFHRACAREILARYEMTEKDIELARQAFDAFARRDVETVVAMSDPNVEFFAATGELAGEEGPHWEKGAYWGHEGVRRYFDDVGRLWAELNVAPEEFEVVGEHLLVQGRVRGQRHDGSLLVTPAQWVWKVRDGKIAYWAVYQDLDEAREAVGLE